MFPFMTAIDWTKARSPDPWSGWSMINCSTCLKTNGNVFNTCTGNICNNFLAIDIMHWCYQAAILEYTMAKQQKHKVCTHSAQDWLKNNPFLTSISGGTQLKWCQVHFECFIRGKTLRRVYITLVKKKRQKKERNVNNWHKQKYLHPNSDNLKLRMVASA